MRTIPPLPTPAHRQKINDQWAAHRAEQKIAKKQALEAGRKKGLQFLANRRALQEAERGIIQNVMVHTAAVDSATGLPVEKSE